MSNPVRAAFDSIAPLVGIALFSTALLSSCSTRNDSVAPPKTPSAQESPTTLAPVTATRTPSATPIDDAYLESALRRLDAGEIVARIESGGVSEDERRMLELLAALPMSSDWPRPSNQELNWLVDMFPTGLTPGDLEFLRFAYGVVESPLLIVEKTKNAYAKYYGPVTPIQRKTMIERGFHRVLDSRALPALGTFTMGEFTFYTSRVNASGMLIQAEESPNAQAATDLTASYVAEFATCVRADIWEKAVVAGSRVSIVDASRFSATPEWSWVFRSNFAAATQSHLDAASGVEFLLGGTTAEVIVKEAVVRSPAGRAIVFHELGHVVYDLIEGSEAESIRETVAASLASGRWDLTYAGTNSEELFAEAVAIYLQGFGELQTWGYPRSRRALEKFDPRLADSLGNLFGCIPTAG